jgi:Uma2 family endonuclease
LKRALRPSAVGASQIRTAFIAKTLKASNSALKIGYDICGTTADEDSMATKTLLTIEQFEHLPEEEGKKIELDEGELKVMSPAMPRHDRVQTRMSSELDLFTRTHRLGAVFVECPFKLSHDTVRVPDVAFIPSERMKELDLDHPIDGAPALAIEVVSPTDLAEELARKVDQYLAAVADAVWVIYPKAREVHAYHAGGASATLGESGVLEDPHLLPGFSLPIRNLFD